MQPEVIINKTELNTSSYLEQFQNWQQELQSIVVEYSYLYLKSLIRVFNYDSGAYTCNVIVECVCFSSY